MKISKIFLTALFVNLFYSGLSNALGLQDSCVFVKEAKVIMCKFKANEIIRSDDSLWKEPIQGIIRAKRLSIDTSKGFYIYLSYAGRSSKEGMDNAKKITIDISSVGGDKTTCGFDRLIAGNCNHTGRLDSIVINKNGAAEDFISDLDIGIQQVVLGS